GSANLFLKIGTPLGYNNPTYELMNLFNANPNDTRKDACFKVWNKSSTVSVPYISKYMDASMTQPLQSENDWIILRFADIKLLYAEILAQDGNFANAHNPLNDVRARAGLDGIGPFGSKEEALDAVYAERRLELAFENQRWFDLLRMAKSYDNPDKPMEILRRHTFETDWAVLYSKYNPMQPPEERFYIKERLLLPIPQAEIDTNNEMVIPQNPTY
ncbi:MAG TPA: RagB/SusD family nutrient uptake outer membrane protein, partial [Paludibacteraceae bacterium]|nr:RagB/SusD family nutrient uptake outer membrane protein [Paludibacteraceae bacterium]